MAVDQGIYQTAKALRLDYGALKKRVETHRTGLRRELPAPERDPPATFVELFSPLSCNIAECDLEVQSPRGVTLRVILRNAPSSVVSSMIRELVG
jgi:hypothetical protein